MKTEQNTKPHPVTGIDHIMYLVGDLEAAAKRFETLGFTLSPRGVHSPHMGSANYTMMFPEDYLELLGILAETPQNVDKRAKLSKRGDSMTAIACRIGDAHAARTALTERGIATTDVLEFSRPLPLPDGSSGMAAFAITVFDAKEVPRGEMFMCNHKTRDMVWRPELMKHPNNARAMAGIIVATATPTETATEYARLFAGASVSETPNGATVVTGKNSAAIICMTPDAVVARYAPLSSDAILHGDFAALQIQVADLAATRSLLNEKGVEFHETADDNGIFVSPSDAAGNVLEFVAR
ncbi:VOC family protein (plasmid) [Agrobacterium tumefaciens]|uniref:VOC family protein n=1 Tax=Agrobacterium tumefaciens TaxID=358 RepID=UPI0015738E85|nr:VOC family protein [Agrobacterium tumefaciens]NSZ66137.1 VOC family protein [Agrobacterium tumefaciens]NTA72508.1 VOC family protein [Agrobacterium tumefaciens]WIE41749.1 VOC family protein [Agrobacterium tumefaciens]